MTKELVIHHGDVTLPPITGRGRKKGIGPNIDRLKEMAPGDFFMDVKEGKMKSLRSSANKAGINIVVRKMPDSDLYFIQKK